MLRSNIELALVSAFQTLRIRSFLFSNFQTFCRIRTREDEGGIFEQAERRHSFDGDAGYAVAWFNVISNAELG